MSTNIIQLFAESKTLDASLYQVVDGILHLQQGEVCVFLDALASLDFTLVSK